jgi:uncharacterized protein YkwD
LNVSHLDISARHAILCLCIVTFWLLSAPTKDAQAQAGVTLYIPIAVHQATTIQQAVPPCTLSELEQQVERHLLSAPEQLRPSLVCNSVLTEVARARALDMAQRNYFDHVNPDGYGPNYLVRQAGYPLPEGYSSAPDANNIESIAAGHQTGDAAWAAWMDSPSHRQHLLAEIPFYTEQIEYGIGHVYLSDGNTYQNYWVVLTARRD